MEGLPTFRSDSQVNDSDVGEKPSEVSSPLLEDQLGRNFDTAKDRKDEITVNLKGMPATC